MSKPDMALIPPVALVHLAKCLEDGKKHGGAFNWRKGDSKLTSMYFISKIMRHVAAFTDGENLTRDSKLSNLASAMADLAILIDGLETLTIIDDRPPKGVAGNVMESYIRKKPYKKVRNYMDMGEDPIRTGSPEEAHQILKGIQTYKSINPLADNATLQAEYDMCMKNRLDDEFDPYSSK